MKYLGLKALIRSKRRFSNYQAKLGKSVGNAVIRDFKASTPN